MKFLRDHWFDLGAGIAVGVAVWLALQARGLSCYQRIAWGSFITLLLHQLEEYRVVGTFPGMMNIVIFRSPNPDRYPLNTQTALIVNVGIGWTSYVLAAVFAERAVWLGIATILVSLGNIVAHLFLFNIKGRSFYNAGLATALLLFAPVVYAFVAVVHREQLATTGDLLGGIALGIALNYFGILKLIDWLADPDSPYVFRQRQLPRKHRSL